MSNPTIIVPITIELRPEYIEQAEELYRDNGNCNLLINCEDCLFFKLNECNDSVKIMKYLRELGVGEDD